MEGQADVAMREILLAKVELLMQVLLGSGSHNYK